MESPDLSPIIKASDNPPVTFTAEERLEYVMEGLSYSDIMRARHNLTVHDTAPSYTFREKRTIRIRITTTNEREEPIQTRISSIFNMFSIGSHKEYQQQIEGIQAGGYNQFYVVMHEERMANAFLERFQNPSSARGSNAEDYFEFTADNFFGKIDNLTFYPVPNEMTKEELKLFLEETVKIGKVEAITWGKHKPSMIWRNGFAHIKIRGLCPSPPDRIIINGRTTTVLIGNEKLYKPCRLCGMRKHESYDCPSLHVFERLTLEKRDETPHKKQTVEEKEDEDIFQDASPNHVSVSQMILDARGGSEAHKATVAGGENTAHDQEGETPESANRLNKGLIGTSHNDKLQSTQNNSLPSLSENELFYPNADTTPKTHKRGSKNKQDPKKKREDKSNKKDNKNTGKRGFNEISPNSASNGSQQTKSTRFSLNNLNFGRGLRGKPP